VSEVDGILVAEFDFSLRGKLGQHFTLALISPKQVVREARSDQPAGHASGGSLLLPPWLGSIGVGESPYRNNVVTGMWGGQLTEEEFGTLVCHVLVNAELSAWTDPRSEYISLVSLTHDHLGSARGHHAFH